MDYKNENAPEYKVTMAGHAPPYQGGPSVGYSRTGQQFSGYPQQPYPKLYSGQPYSGQPYSGQPNSGQPYSGQPYSGQPYQAQPSRGETVITVQPQMPLSPPENDYLGYSIFTLLCCCMPLGIAAVIYSVNTRDANNAGNREEAVRRSRCARTLNHTALGLGLVILVIWIVLVILLMR